MSDTELDSECTSLTTLNDTDRIELTKKQEEISDEQAKLTELTQIVEQKGRMICIFFDSLIY